MSGMRKILVVGAGGRLGAALSRCSGDNFEVRGLTRAQLDLADLDQAASILGALDFDVLVNCAAQTNVDRCEEKPAEAFAINAAGPEGLAQLCAEKNAQLIHISTDYVFDGEKREPYTEEDEASPISVYGASKLEGERRVLAISAENVVARVSWVFGPDRPSFIDWIVQRAREKEAVAAVADKISTPSYTLDLSEMLARFWEPGSLMSAGTSSLPGGIYNLTNRGQCSWQESGQWALDCCRAEGLQLRAEIVDATTLCAMKQFVARRPVHSVLSTEKYERLAGYTPRPWRDAVRAYVREHLVRAARS